MRVYILLTGQSKRIVTPAYGFSGARGRVLWPTHNGAGLGRAGAYNAFLRLGWIPQLVLPDALPEPLKDDILVVCESEELDALELRVIKRWIQANGEVLASGASESWAAFFPGTALESRCEENPYSGLAFILGGRAPQLVAPAKWRYIYSKSWATPDVKPFGYVAAIHGERQTPTRALVSVRFDAPAVVRMGRFVLLNADPFAAFQAWLQGQEDLEPWLSWRNRLFWLDELVAFVRQFLVHCGTLIDGSVGAGIPGLEAITVVLRHDLDDSRDTTYLELENARNAVGVHALLKDANTSFWVDKLSANTFHESAFHYNTANCPKVKNWLRRKILKVPDLPYLPAYRDIAGKGLLRQVRWAKNSGIGIRTLHRHLSILYYPEYVDALDAVFRSEPEVLGGSSYYRGQVLRWGVDRIDGMRGSYADFPDPQFPYWFPFRLGHAGDAGRLLRGLESASMMEIEPNVVEQMLDYKIAGLPQRVITLTYHPAHANRSTFVANGSAIWFAAVLDLLLSRKVPILTLREVFGRIAAVTSPGVTAPTLI